MLETSFISALIISGNLEIELFAPYDIVKNTYGAEFIQASNYSFRYDVKDNAQFRLDNLYNGNKELSKYIL